MEGALEVAQLFEAVVLGVEVPDHHSGVLGAGGEAQAVGGELAVGDLLAVVGQGLDVVRGEVLAGADVVVRQTGGVRQPTVVLVDRTVVEGAVLDLTAGGLEKREKLNFNNDFSTFYSFTRRAFYLS